MIPFCYPDDRHSGFAPPSGSGNENDGVSDSDFAARLSPRLYKTEMLGKDGKVCKDDGDYEGVDEAWEDNDSCRVKAQAIWPVLLEMAMLGIISIKIWIVLTMTALEHRKKKFCVHESI